MGLFLIQRPRVKSLASSNGLMVELLTYCFVFWGSIMSGQNHQTLSRFTFWATIDTWYCCLLASHGPHWWTCWKDTHTKIVCVCFQWFDQTFFFFCFLSYLNPTDPSRCPSAAFQLSRAIKYIVAPPLSVFNPEKVETWNPSLVSVSTDPADGTVSADALDWTARGTSQSVTRADEAAP